MVAADEYRLERIERDIENLRNELHEKYLDKFQLMADYMSKVENEKMLNTRHTRLLTTTTLVCTLTAVVNVILAASKVI